MEIDLGARKNDWVCEVAGYIEYLQTSILNVTSYCVRLCTYGLEYKPLGESLPGILNSSQGLDLVGLD